MEPTQRSSRQPLLLVPVLLLLLRLLRLVLLVDACCRSQWCCCSHRLGSVVPLPEREQPTNSLVIRVPTGPLPPTSREKRTDICRQLRGRICRLSVSGVRASLILRRGVFMVVLLGPILLSSVVPVSGAKLLPVLQRMTVGFSFPLLLLLLLLLVPLLLWCCCSQWCYLLLVLVLLLPMVLLLAGVTAPLKHLFDLAEKGLSALVVLVVPTREMQCDLLTVVPLESIVLLTKALVEPLERLPSWDTALLRLVRLLRSAVSFTMLLL